MQSQKKGSACHTYGHSHDADHNTSRAEAECLWASALTVIATKQGSLVLFALTCMRAAYLRRARSKQACHWVSVAGSFAGSIAGLVEMDETAGIRRSDDRPAAEP
jgi:hypothetical protein